MASQQLSVGDIGTSLNARTTVSVGDSFGVPYNGNTSNRSFSWEITYPVTPATIAVALQGSLDEITWYDLDTHALVTPLLKHVVDKSVRFLRANATTLTGALASVTVKILI